MDSDADRGSRALGEPGPTDRRARIDGLTSGVNDGVADRGNVGAGTGLNPQFEGSSDRTDAWSDPAPVQPEYPVGPSADGATAPGIGALGTSSPGTGDATTSLGPVVSPRPSGVAPRTGRHFRRAHDAVPADESTYADEDSSPAALRWREIEAKRARKARRSFWVELPILLLVAFVMTFIIQTFFFKVYYIPSPSMEKTLHGVSQGGDRVLVNKIVYSFSEPDPGEVVVFSGPPTWAAEANIPGPTTWYGKFFQSLGSVVGIAPPNEKDFVKRVIATGGQTVQCCDSLGNVTVNGIPLTEPYIYENFAFRPGIEDCTTPQQSERCFGPVTIPAGQLWMMGDHRLVSKDSAFGCRHGLPVTQCQGPVPVDNVIGHAIAIVMPVSRWSGIGSPDIQGGAIGLVLTPFLLRRRPRHGYRSSRWQHR